MELINELPASDRKDLFHLIKLKEVYSTKGEMPDQVLEEESTPPQTSFEVEDVSEFVQSVLVEDKPVFESAQELDKQVVSQLNSMHAAFSKSHGVVKSEENGYEFKKDLGRYAYIKCKHPDCAFSLRFNIREVGEREFIKLNKVERISHSGPAH